MNVNNLTLNDKLSILSGFINDITEQFPIELKKTKYALIDLDGQLFHTDAIEFDCHTNDYISLLRQLRQHKETIVDKLLVDYNKSIKGEIPYFKINLGLIKSVNGLTVYYNQLSNLLLSGKLFKKELQKSAYYCVVSGDKSLWQNSNIDPLKETEPVVDGYTIEPVSYKSWANYLYNTNPLIVLKKANKELKLLKKVLPLELESIINQSSGHSKNKLIGLIKTTLVIETTRKESAHYFNQLLTNTLETDYNQSQLNDCS